MFCTITIRVICIDCIKDAHSLQVWKVKPFCTAFNCHQGHIKNNAGFRHFAITDYKRFKVLTLVLSVSKQDFHPNQWVMPHQSFIVSVVTDWTDLKCLWTFAVPMCQCNNMSGSRVSCFGSWLALSQQGWETPPIFIVSTIVIPYYHTKKRPCVSRFFYLLIPKEAGGEARSTDKAAREARPSRHQHGPAGCPGVAQRPPNEGDHCELTVFYLSEHKTQPWLSLWQ